MTDADRDALRDLLGAARAVIADRPASAPSTLIDAAARAQRHVDRTSAEPGDRDTDAARSILRRLGLHANSGATSWVAEVIARRHVEGREAALRPFEELYSTGPDTVGRTTWRPEDGLRGTALPHTVECVEVPVDDLRDAFDAAGGAL